MIKVILMSVFVAIVIMPATTKAVDPTAVAMTTNVTTAGGTQYSFTVRYNDDGPLLDTFDSDDVRISGPGGFDVPAAFVSVMFNASGNQAVATYSIVPPGGSWDFADNGTYNVVMQANQVFDSLNNPVAPGNIGSFTVMTPSSTPTPTPTPRPATLGNIATRLQVGTGANVMIAGFIVQGSAPKRVLIRAIGPSLANFGIPNALANPLLELHSASSTIGMNNDWQTTQIGGVITSDQAVEIQSSGAAPSDPLESAIIATLEPGSYSAIVQGVNGGTGVGSVEVYDLSTTSASFLANIATRGFVQTEANVMIGGFIVVTQPTRVIIRAIGPSLGQFGVPDPLANPQLELHDATSLIGQNNDWQTTQIGGIITTDQVAEIQKSQLAPSNTLESAIIATLAPGSYTAIVSGVNNTTGNALVEVYALP